MPLVQVFFSFLLNSFNSFFRLLVYVDIFSFLWLYSPPPPPPKKKKKKKKYKPHLQYLVFFFYNMLGCIAKTCDFLLYLYTKYLPKKIDLNLIVLNNVLIRNFICDFCKNRYFPTYHQCPSI